MPWRIAPDWILYPLAAGLIILGARALREGVNAPAPPPPVPGEEAVPLAPDLPFDHGRIVRTDARPSATAFSISDRGVWLTAREAVEGCGHPGLIIAEGRAVEAEVEIAEDTGVAILTTMGGAPALPVASRSGLKSGERAYVAGFRYGRPGEASLRLVGPADVHAKARGQNDIRGLAWAETGRTDEMGPGLDGLVGAPLLDTTGHVAGVMLRDEARRGVVLATTPTAVALALAASREPPAARTPQPISPDNYGRMADQLRLSLSVAKVACLER
jgi:hypothetical protein